MSPTSPRAASTALLTDHYELTMLQAALASGEARRRCVFEAFARRLPDGRRYGVIAGTGRVLEALEQFRFVDDELRFLSDQKVLLETLVLSILNHDTAIASAASRMTTAAVGRPCIEMGSRRTHEESAVAAARAAYVAGFEATSNLEAGRRYGVPTTGTAAHAFTLLYDSEKEAFTAQVVSLGNGTTLLVDTYDVRTAVALAMEIAGPELGAVRLDSGDLLIQATEVRAQLDEAGNTDTRIIVTSDLDEYAIAGLAAGPVSGYGVGTALVTGSGAPTASMVYKLVQREDASGHMQGVAKKSKDKTSVGGRKWAMRRLSDSGVAQAEVIGIGEHPRDDGNDRPLMIDLVRAGAVVDHQDIHEARARHEASRAELPRAAAQLSRGEPVIPTIYEED